MSLAPSRTLSTDSGSGPASLWGALPRRCRPRPRPTPSRVLPAWSPPSVPLLGPEALEKAPTEDGDEENDQRPTLGQFSRQCHLGLPIERAHAGPRWCAMSQHQGTERSRRPPEESPHHQDGFLQGLGPSGLRLGAGRPGGARRGSGKNSRSRVSVASQATSHSSRE